MPSITLVPHKVSTRITDPIVSHDPLVASYVDFAYDLHDGQLIPHATREEETL